MKSFSKKNVLITGAAGSIGVTLCKTFADAGAQVIALDNHAGRLGTLAEAAKSAGVNYYTICADITHFEEVNQAITKAQKEVGFIDVLINNAGFAFTYSLGTTTVENWHKDINLNLNGAFHCVESVRPQMMENKKGVIINIGSVNAYQAYGNPGYSAAKVGLINYTQALATEFGKHGIRANIICPGTVNTLGWKARTAREPEIFERLKKWYPLGHIIEAEDVAEAALFLASDAARSITGAVLNVDAGLMAGNAVLARELTLENI